VRRSQGDEVSDVVRPRVATVQDQGLVADRRHGSAADGAPDAGILSADEPGLDDVLWRRGRGVVGPRRGPGVRVDGGVLGPAGQPDPDDPGTDQDDDDAREEQPTARPVRLATLLGGEPVVIVRHRDSLTSEASLWPSPPMLSAERVSQPCLFIVTRA
jgi:hypothetical protein